MNIVRRAHGSMDRKELIKVTCRRERDDSELNKWIDTETLGSIYREAYT